MARRKTLLTKRGARQRSPKPSDTGAPPAGPEYPTWDGNFSLRAGGREIIGPSVSPNSGVPWSEIARVIGALEQDGRLTPWPDTTLSPRPWPSPETRDCIRELQAKGADGNRLLRMLCGLDPSQRVNLVFLVNTVGGRKAETPLAKQRNKELLSRWRRYSGVERLGLCDDPALRAETRAALRKDLDAIGLTLALLRADNPDHPDRNPDHPYLPPESGITVRPTVDLSRQGFWDRPLVAFVDYLTPILGNNKEAHEETARLFHLAFDYPDDPRRVMLRVYRHRNRAPEAPSPPAGDMYQPGDRVRTPEGIETLVIAAQDRVLDEATRAELRAGTTVAVALDGLSIGLYPAALLTTPRGARRRRVTGKRAIKR